MKMRDIGFVVGQSNWNRKLDSLGGSSALTKTKIYLIFVLVNAELPPDGPIFGSNWFAPPQIQCPAFSSELYAPLNRPSEPVMDKQKLVKLGSLLY